MCESSVAQLRIVRACSEKWVLSGRLQPVMYVGGGGRFVCAWEVLCKR